MEQQLTPELLQDLNLSMGVVAHLEAGLAGALGFYETLRLVKSSFADEKGLMFAQKGLGKVQLWLRMIEERSPLLSARWNRPETFEARDIFEYLELLKGDVQQLLSLVVKLTSSSSLRLTDADVKLIIAAQLRCDIAKTTALKREILLAAGRGDTGAEEEFQGIFAETLKAAQRSNALADSYLDGTYKKNPSFAAELMEILTKLPMLLALQVHDLVLLLGMYTGVTYDVVAIPPREVPKWQALGFAPTEASYWRSHGFLPDEVLKWRQHGFSHPGDASDWRDRGFSVTEAWSLRENGQDPEAAALSRARQRQESQRPGAAVKQK